MSLDNAIGEVVIDSRRNPKAAEKLNYAVKKIRKELGSRSYKWMRSVLFPEFSKGARYPGRFSIESGVYTLSTEYTIKTPESQYFGVCVKPHANNVTDPLVYNFPNSTSEDWGTGYSINPYGSSEENPLFPPELFFSNSRLVSCAVHVECISQETSGKIKGGIEYDCNPEFYSPGIDVQRKIAYMLHSACVETSIYYVAKAAVTAVLQEPAMRNATAAQRDLRIGEMAFAMCLLPGEAALDFNTLQLLYNGLMPTGNMSAQSIIPDVIPDSEMNLFDRAMKYWRTWYNNSIVQNLRDRHIFKTTVLKLMYQMRAGNDWPMVRSANLGVTEQNLKLHLGSMLFPYYENVTSDYVAFKARSAMRNYGSVFKTLDSSMIRGGPMKYMRLNMLSYKQENDFDEGIRVVYVPKRIEESSYDNSPSDVIFIGGLQVPKLAALRIKVIRHFEGQVYPGMRQLYPVFEEPEDEEAVKTIIGLLKKFPEILKIKLRNLSGAYRMVKDKFKWADLALREDGSGFEVIRDYSEPMQLEVPQTE
jgi:hypothetical protein